MTNIRETLGSRTFEFMNPNDRSTIMEVLNIMNINDQQKGILLKSVLERIDCQDVRNISNQQIKKITPELVKEVFAALLVEDRSEY